MGLGLKYTAGAFAVVCASGALVFWAAGLTWGTAEAGMLAGTTLLFGVVMAPFAGAVAEIEGVYLTCAEYRALKADADKWRNPPVESLGREHAP